MKLDKSLEPFRAALESLRRLLHKFDERGVIIGGIAVSLLGKPRYTADIDAVFLLPTSDTSKLLELANAEAFARAFKTRKSLPAKTAWHC